jgi:hypothetical protein
MNKLPKPKFKLGEEVWVSHHTFPEDVDLFKGVITGIETMNDSWYRYKVKCDLVHDFIHFDDTFKINKKKDAIKKTKQDIKQNIKRLKWLLNRHELIDREVDILCKDEGTDFWRD